MLNKILFWFQIFEKTRNFEFESLSIRTRKIRNSEVPIPSY